MHGPSSGGPPGTRIPVNIEDEMRTSYLDYAMSVIMGRALPDVRDGLKPVQRRILYAMFREGLLHNRRYSKCAGVVGEVLKKYHPHGDAAVYDTLVRLAQEWNMRYPLIDGQGNFGSVDGDPAAAYRYTESRMTALAEELLADIDKETVDFQPNFDDQTVEPRVLPTRVPNLLVNGSQGIAVGMATNIPPHNLAEIVDACMHLIDHPNASVETLMKLVPGPDFPTAGILMGREGIRQAYETGRGKLKMRARASIEINERTERASIIVTEIPYQVNKARLIEDIAEHVREKRLEGISDLRDESDRDGMRIVIELKRDAVPAVVQNQLFKMTALESSFGVTLLSIVGGQPRVLSLREMLNAFLDHRREVVRRRSVFELREAERHREIVEGLGVAVQQIDRVIEIIRSSSDVDEARARLLAEPLTGLAGFLERAGRPAEEVAVARARGPYLLNEAQAKSILEMRLSKLTGLEREKLEHEYATLCETIARLRAILADVNLLLGVIKSELAEIKSKYEDPRRTEIVPDEGEIDIEDLIAEEDVVVTVTHAGYVKRAPLTAWRAQRRGGKGKTGVGTKDEDPVTELFVASTHAYILVFSSKGQVYWLKVYDVPAGGRNARGKPIVNLVQMDPDEKVAALIPVRAFEDGKFVFLATRNGVVKKTDLMSYANPRAMGIIGTSIEPGDALVAGGLTDGTRDIFIGTKAGMSIRFPENDVRPMGRNAVGVKGITLEENDEVVGMAVLEPGASILTVCGNGFGKRTDLDQYRLQSRGGKGIVTIKTTERNGEVVGFAQVRDADDVILVTDKGTMIRFKVEHLRELGRNTQGVRLLAVEENEQVVGIAHVSEPEGVVDPAAGDEAAGDEAANGAEGSPTNGEGGDRGDGGPEQGG
jgi:DNA gyrase subunit A